MLATLTTNYRFVIVTLLMAAAAITRVLYPELVLPADEDIANAVDAVGVLLAPVISLLAFRSANTTSGTVKETPNA